MTMEKEGEKNCLVERAILADLNSNMVFSWEMGSGTLFYTVLLCF